MVTGNLARKNDPAHLFVDPATADGASSGLRMPSLVSCNNVFTVDQADIITTLGHLSDALAQHFNDCVKAALGLSVVGAIPRMPAGRSSEALGWIVHLESASSVAEAFRSVRTAVTFGEAAQALLVTLCAPPVGDR